MLRGETTAGRLVPPAPPRSLPPPSSKRAYWTAPDALDSKARAVGLGAQAAALFPRAPPVIPGRRRIVVLPAVSGTNVARRGAARAWSAVGGTARARCRDRNSGLWTRTRAPPRLTLIPRERPALSPIRRLTDRHWPRATDTSRRLTRTRALHLLPTGGDTRGTQPPCRIRPPDIGDVLRPGRHRDTPLLGVPARARILPGTRVPLDPLPFPLHLPLHLPLPLPLHLSLGHSMRPLPVAGPVGDDDRPRVRHPPNRCGYVPRHHSRGLAVDRPGSPMVTTPLPTLPMPAVVVAVMPVEPRHAHNRVQARPRIVDHQQSLGVAIPILVEIDIPPIDRAAGNPIVVVVHRSAAPEGQRTSQDRD